MMWMMMIPSPHTNLGRSFSKLLGRRDIGEAKRNAGSEAGGGFRPEGPKGWVPGEKGGSHHGAGEGDGFGCTMCC